MTAPRHCVGDIATPWPHRAGRQNNAIRNQNGRPLVSRLSVWPSVCGARRWRLQEDSKTAGSRALVQVLSAVLSAALLAAQLDSLGVRGCWASDSLYQTAIRVRSDKMVRGRRRWP